MHPPRVPVRTLLMVVVVAALDFTAVRALFASEPYFGIALMGLITALPIGLALNLALFRILGTRGRPRAFWVGFLVAGTLAMCASVWAALTPPGWGPSPTGVPNPIRHASRMWVLWNGYTAFAAQRLRDLGVAIPLPRSLDRPGFEFIALMGLIAFVPQLTLALIGGQAARLMIRGRRDPPERSRPV